MVVSQPNSPGRRMAEDAFWTSTPGRAVRAFEHGDEFFSYEEPHHPASSTGVPRAGHTTRTDTLARVEAAGWRLQHANWVNDTDGTIVGIYLFRRDDTRPDRVTGPGGRAAAPPRPVLRLHTD